jgi:tRNA 5-methylaminomethyl-2-thiouridine biosynthesis bifunctional protein
MLHYVGVLSASEAEQLQTVLTLLTAQKALASRFAALDEPGTAELRKTLAAQCFGLLPGFHRILLEEGKVSLTLCVGEPSEALAQQVMQADCLLVTCTGQTWDKWRLKALARCCKRGTQLYFWGELAPALPLLMDAGFALQAPAPPEPHSQPASPDLLHAQFDPRWTLRSSRRTGVTHTRAATSATPATAGHCSVIGAGIAGASVARALALRGWHVDVYDAQPTCAGGASALPVGLVVPHHSADDSARSRLSRAGTRLTLQHAERLLQAGQDWSPSGVLELIVDEADLADAEAEVLSEAAARHAPTGWSSHWRLGQAQGLWHPHAAWIKPARLVQQWLHHARIRFHGAAHVHGVRRAQAQWLLLDAQGAELGRAERVVFANAHGCAEVLERLAIQRPNDVVWLPGVLHKLQSLQAMRGTLSLGSYPTNICDSAFPRFPVNGHGSFVAGVPSAQGPQWVAGSTFQTEALLHADVEREHALNLKKLQALLPDAAAALSAQFADGSVQAWQGTRCITHDRLPLVGPLEDASSPGLWLCAGMGARGLSFSALCAELLAAWWGGEPLPVENKLAKLLATSRVQRTQSR